jgi:hypothetical protein
MVYAVKTDRMYITLSLSAGYIFVQQKWRYNWIDNPTMSPWTLQEKRDFHNKSDKLIWSLWSSHAYVTITGNSQLAQEYRNTKFRINVDIKWVVGRENEHWNVNVKKVPQNQYSTSSGVQWNNRVIQLESSDVEEMARPGYINPTIIYRKNAVSHEFGHSFGNSIYARDAANNPMHGDEYKEPALSRFQDDGSIMSVGSGVRKRHYDFLKLELERMTNLSFDISLF